MGRTTVMIAITGVLLAGAAACLWPTDEREFPHILVDPQAPQDTTLHPLADTWTLTTAPNRNYGTQGQLWSSVGTKHTWVRWDQQQIAAVVGEGTLLSARAEFTIISSLWSQTGGEFSIHRVTTDWTELGATGNCAIDTNTVNEVADCSGPTAWTLTDPEAVPWVVAPTDSIVMSNGQTGTISLDVTADVAAFLQGTANYGWVIRPRDESVFSEVRLQAREAASQPVLVLTLVQGQDWPVLDTYPQLDTTRVVVSQSENDTVVIFRTEIQLRFEPTVSNAQRVAFVTEHQMTVIGITGDGNHFVRIPDPGPSLEAYLAVLDSLNAEPEIYLAVPIYRSPTKTIKDSRYPSDGTGQQRADWLTPTSATWALRAIRAPLAWGCENGKYGGRRVKVAIFEWAQQPAHPEIGPSLARFWQPPDAEIAAYAPEPAHVRVSHEKHASGIAGLISAEGDNHAGIAGLTWQTELYLYAGASPSGHPLPLESGLHLFVNRLILDGPDVLSLSIDGEFRLLASEALRDLEARNMASIFEHLMVRLPKLLIVVAAGNDRFRGTVSSYVGSRRSAIMRSGLLLLRTERPEFADRIIVVAGTTPGNSFWEQSTQNPDEGSNFFTAATDVAAPAHQVRMLDRWSGQTGSAIPLTTESGTSFATAMVAGSAALLLAMDSTLPPDSVKDFIVRGAREPRLNPTNGTFARYPVQGAPETVYELDVYGALTVLARTDTTVPICGFPAYATGADITLERGGIYTTHIATPEGATFLTRVSVAQGGRLLAATSNLGVLQFDHRGTQVGPALTSLHRRMFLEKDTADWFVKLSDEGGDTLRLRPAGTIVDLRARVAPEPFWSTFQVHDLTVSPTGEWATVSHLESGYLDSLPQWALGNTLIRISGGPPITVAGTSQTCDPDSGECPWTGTAGWSNDGQRVIYAVPIGEGVRTDLYSITFPGGSPALTSPVPVVDRSATRPWFLADDSVVVMAEVILSSHDCQRTMREAANISNRFGDVLSPADCAAFRRTFNGRPVAADGASPQKVVSAEERYPELRRLRRE